MIIKFKISRNQAITACMYLIGFGIEIKNKERFRGELASYFYLFGSSSLTDHEQENQPHLAKAVQLVDKYFK